MLLICTLLISLVAIVTAIEQKSSTVEQAELIPIPVSKSNTNF